MSAVLASSAEPGRMLRRRMSGFLRILKDNGFVIGLAEARDALRVAAERDLMRPALLKSAAKGLLCARRSDWTRFDEIFDGYWLAKGMKRVTRLSGEPQEGERPVRKLDAAGAPQGTPTYVDRTERLRGEGRENPADGRGRQAGASSAEAIERKDFRFLTDAEARAAVDALVDRLARVMRARITRRRRAARRGETLDLRRTLRASVRRGGDPIDLFHRRPKRKPLRPVLLLDVSGSMSQYSAIFLRFAHGLLHGMADADAFVFHTRLVHIGPALSERSSTRAAERMALMSEGFAGGTRIGDSFRTFARQHAAKALRGRSVLMILSDGYDTGEPEALAAVMAELSRRTRRIVWLNPLIGWEGYQPVAGGMAAALPHVDLFAPAHSIESLAALEPYLARI